MGPDLHQEWTFSFRKNVHMYCHSLTAKKGGLQYDVPCEDSPMGFVGVWPYELELDDISYRNFIESLIEWANSIGLEYRIYTTRHEFITNAG